MKYINLLLSLLFLIFFIESNSQTLKLETSEQLSKIELNSSLDNTFGFSANELPSNFSLEKYCPPIRTQDGASCVGWAVAYGAGSILYNSLNNITSKDEKFINAFDPYYVYSSIKSNEANCLGVDCGCGTFITEALDLAVNYGLKKMYVSPELKCSSTLNTSALRNINDRTQNYSFDQYVRISTHNELSNGEFETIIDVEDFKQILNFKVPIITGIGVSEEFGKLGSSNSLYKPDDSNDDGGHAVTIIGYDDYKYGGSFRIMNSYGTDWGDNGYFWMTYKDFKRKVNSAFVMYSEEYSSWTTDYTSGSYYKGSFSGEINERWEGGINLNNKSFNGNGIYTGPKFSGFGSYKDGYRHGYWVMLGNLSTNDPFRGWVLFDNGKVLEGEAFGFSSESIRSRESIISGFHLENIISEDDDLANEDYFSEDDLDNLSNESKINKKSFNFQKTNNYNK